MTWEMGRHMRRDTVRRLAGAKLDRMIEVLRKHGLLAMTLLMKSTLKIRATTIGGRAPSGP